MKQLPLVLLAILCLGCGDKSTTAAEQTEPKTSESTSILVDAIVGFEGPGGSVAIGGSLADAKAAFPSTPDAEVFDTSLNFAILAVDGWSWGDEVANQAFEVALENDEIMAISVLEFGTPDSANLDDKETGLGEPTNSAESENASVKVWVSGEYARFHVILKKDNPLLGIGNMRIVGPKEKLKLLNYHHDSPEVLVEQMDALVEMEFPSDTGGEMSEDE